MAAVAVAASACGGPSIGDGQVACGAGEDCPPGLRCSPVDGHCWRGAGPLPIDGAPDGPGPRCGDGRVDPGEVCDPCPPCSDGNICTIDFATGSAAACDLRCTITPVMNCGGGDLCCPAGCTAVTDADCSTTCGNGTVDTGETCDPPAVPCPATCDDGVACTEDIMTGSPENCSVACGHAPIAICRLTADGCCPPGCTSATDGDCSSGLPPDAAPPPPPPPDASWPPDARVLDASYTMDAFCFAPCSGMDAM